MKSRSLDLQHATFVSLIWKFVKNSTLQATVQTISDLRRTSAKRRRKTTFCEILTVQQRTDDRQVTLIALLDLSAAFDCVDHALLLRRLQYNFGFTDDVLRWMTSFVSGRTQQVSYDGQLSPIRPVQFGVCLLYTSPSPRD